MPTRQDVNLKGDHKLKRKNLQDNILLGGYYVNGYIETNMNVSLTYQPHWCYIRRKSQKYQVRLECIRKNEHGFIVYALDNDACHDDNFTKALKGAMNPSIYHYIKGAFHEHENHPVTTDALLRPYISENEPSQKDEQEILLFYLKQYKYKFEDFYVYANEEYKTARDRINGLFNVNKGIKALMTLIEKGNAIKGEQKYYEYLRTIASRKAYLPKQFKKDVSRQIHDIDNLLSHATHSYNICTAGLGVKYGRHGIFFGIAGIFVSLFSIWYSIKEQPTYDIPTLRQIDSITNANIKPVKDTISAIHTNIREMERKVYDAKNARTVKKTQGERIQAGGTALN